MNMNKLDEILAQLKKQEAKENKKCRNVVLWVLAIIGCVAAVAGNA